MRRWNDDSVNPVQLRLAEFGQPLRYPRKLVVVDVRDFLGIRFDGTEDAGEHLERQPVPAAQLDPNAARAEARQSNGTKILG